VNRQRFSLSEHAFRVEIFSSFEAAGLMPEEAKICQWLSTYGQAVIAYFLEVFPLSKATMNRRLNKLIEDGWIRSHGQGRSTFYTIDDALRTDETKRDDKN
jgi:hypothetical protein